MLLGCWIKLKEIREYSSLYLYIATGNKNYLTRLFVFLIFNSAFYLHILIRK